MLHGLGAYFAPEPPLWEDPMLVRDVERANAVAEKLGDARAIVLAGNGAVTVGTEVRQAAAPRVFPRRFGESGPGGASERRNTDCFTHRSRPRAAAPPTLRSMIGCGNS